jgi:type IV pilus assembly protein PilC
VTPFEYRAVSGDGRVFRGTLAALNEADLQARLARLDLHVVRAQQARSRGLRVPRARHIGARERLDFYVQLHTLLAAGVPLVETLTDIRDGAAPGSALAQAVGITLQRMESGATLAAALAEQPALADAQMLGLLRAGESSGSLKAVLERIVQMLKWRDELTAKIRKAVSYPAFTAAVVAGAVTFLMIYLVPQLVQFLRAMGQELPWQTRALIAVSDAFVHRWYLIFGAPVALALAAAALLRRYPALRHRVDAALLRLPLAGALLLKIELARFAATLALMYKSGIPLLDGLRQAEDAVVNRALREVLARARRLIAQGAGLAEAFASLGLLPATLIRMLRVGERSGELDRALDHVTYFYNRDVDETIERLQSKIEPTLTLILGLLLAWVLSAVLGPVYDAIGNIRT